MFLAYSSRPGRRSHSKWRKATEGQRQPRSPNRDIPEADAERSRDVSTSSSELRDGSAHGKRNSLFLLRPKSVASNNGSAHSHSHSGTAGSTHSRRSSLAAARPTSPPENREGSKTRLLFGRSRRTKVLGSRIRSSSPIDADDESDRRKNDRTRDRHKRNTSNLSASSTESYRISAPFGFQHIASIEKEQFIATTPSSKRRALRKPLPQSIRASPAEIRQSLALMPDRSQKGPPPLRPKRSDEMLTEEEESPTAPSVMQTLRLIRSAESFSQPDRPSTAPLTSQAAFHPPPWRSSIRMAGPPGVLPDQIPDNLSHALSSLHPPTNAEKTLTLSGEWDRLLPFYQSRMSNTHMEPLIPLPLYSGPGSAASPPLFSLPLEKVIEEPEGTISARQSMSLSRQSFLRHSRSSPNLARKSLLQDDSLPELPQPSSSTERPVSQSSDTLGDPAHLPIRVSQEDVKVPVIQNETEAEPKSFLSMSQDVTDAWEEYIDYCYEQSAEANCDFDWSNTSRLELGSTDEEEDDEPRPWEKKRRISMHQPHLSVESTSGGDVDSFQTHDRTFIHSGLQAPELLPDLDSQSAHSLSTGSINILTPADKLSLQSGGAIEVAASTPEMPPLDPDMPDFYDKVRGEYHEFLMEAKSLPVGVRPKNRLRQEGRINRITPTSEPIQLPSQQPALEDIPDVRARADSAPGQRPSPIPPLGSLVDQLRGPHKSPERPTFPQNQRRGRDSPKPRFRSRSRPRKPEDIVPPGPVPPIPQRAPSRTDNGNLLKPSTGTQKPLTPPETPAIPSSSPNLDDNRSSPNSTEQLPLQTLPITTYAPSTTYNSNSSSSPPSSRKVSLARTVSAATVPFMLDDSLIPSAMPGGQPLLAPVAAGSPPLTPAMSVSGHEPLLQLSQLGDSIDFVIPQSPVFPPSPTRAPPQISMSSLKTPAPIGVPPVPEMFPVPPNASQETLSTIHQEVFDSFAPLQKSFSASSTPSLLGTPFPASGAMMPRSAGPMKTNFGTAISSEGAARAESPQKITHHKRGHQSYSLFPAAPTNSADQLRMRERIFTN